MADALVRQGVDPIEFVSTAQGQRLDTTTAFVKRTRDAPKSEVLREALEDLDKDRSFDVTNSDETFVQLDREIGPRSTSSWRGTRI